MSDVKTPRQIKYGYPDPNDPGPRFIVRGWDDGKVFVTVYCACGTELFDDGDQSAFSTYGVVQFRCNRCEVTYSVTVGATVYGD